MATALITGVEGFTGYYLADELVRQGHTVVGIGVKPCLEGLPLVNYAQVDLLDATAVTKTVGSLQPDLVFHLAGISHVMSAPDTIYRVNVAASRNLLAALAGLKTLPSFILMASTANLYGNAGGTLDESTPPDPRNDYAVSKLSMEYMANIWQDRLPITIVRPFNYTGKGQPESFLIPKLVKHFKERLPVIELGNTHIIREFGDVRDVASCYARLAAVHAPWGPFNICSGVGHTLNSILELLQKITGQHPEIRVNPAFVRPNEVHKLLGSPLRLETCIGPLRPLGLEQTLHWMLGE